MAGFLILKDMTPKTKFASLEQARAYVEMMSISQIIEGYATLLYESQFTKAEPIKISQSQFESMFKIIGLTSDGREETRGRKPKQH